jgi:pyruvate dehydrogenase E1 component alpha subunit
MIFLCENNLYGEFTPSHTVTAGKLIDRPRAFGIPCVVVDGNDVEEVAKATADAVERARNGGGPSYIEAMTYRIRGHMEAERELLGGGKYREQAEIDSWKERDPIIRLRHRLLSFQEVDEASLNAIETDVDARVEAAAKFAEESEVADPKLVDEIMFVEHRA